MSRIKRVVLYKHGVGHFEREASISGDDEVRLAFRSQEMNDVLKSLTVYDSGGGAVSSVSYDNKKPIAKLLSDISLDIPTEGGSVPLLASLRGAEVSVSVGSREVEGQIVGVDFRNSFREGQVSQRCFLTVFEEKGRLQTFDLDEVAGVTFKDPELQSDMQFLFATVFSAKKQDTKSLKVFSRGQGERTLNLSYVVECPVWKTSYRIALPREDSDQKAFLQGWALVDNPQDEDWKDVQLSLVSGLPISFRHDLYSPRYLHRQEVEVETESAAGPVMAEGSLFDEAYESDDLFGAAESEMPGSYVCASPAPVPRRRRVLGGGGAVEQSAAKVETITQKTGQLFEYKIDRPVTVLRNQSALVPIVADRFEGGKKLLYNQAQRDENPFSVVDFKNSTGLTLEGGPVTIYEGEIYAGEAMLDTLAPDEERMLPYAVALEVEVKVETETRDTLIAQSVTQSVWTQKRALYNYTTYRLVNKSKQAKTVVVEHPLSKAELVRSPQPDSETRNYRRFLVKLPAGGKEDLRLTEKTVETDQQAFANTNLKHVLILLEGMVEEKPPILAQLKELSERMNELVQEQHDNNQYSGNLQAGQARIRENLKSLGSTEEERRLRSRYVTQLDKEETQIAECKAKNDNLRLELAEAEREFRKLAGEITLERVFEG